MWCHISQAHKPSLNTQAHKPSLKFIATTNTHYHKFKIQQQYQFKKKSYNMKRLFDLAAHQCLRSTQQGAERTEYQEKIFQT
jgi:hypothetical protein